MKTFDVLPSDPVKNPSVIDARNANSDYIIYYAQNNSERWDLERVSDGVIVASGTLEAMLALTNLFPNSRRACWAEDMLRMGPGVFALEYNYGKIFK